MAARSVIRSRSDSDDIDLDSDEEDGGRLALISRTLDTTVKYTNSHKKFINNLSLAFWVGFWVAVFGLPSYYRDLSDIVFGERMLPADWVNFTKIPSGAFSPCKDAFVPSWNPETNNFTLANRTFHTLGKVRNMKNATEPPMMVEYANGLPGGPWDQKNVFDVWCGYLPQYYHVYWGNVAQMVIFTAYCNTGVTIQLAWQGIIGTFLASANIYLMGFIYPYGAREIEQPCTDADVDDPDCRMASLSDGQKFKKVQKGKYNVYVTAIDVVLVIMLFLISRAAENTIKFGLSWHVYYMMNFMNPHIGVNDGRFKMFISDVQWDSEYTAVVLTSIIGASIAVWATIFPKPLLNIRKVYDDAATTAGGISEILDDAINYFVSNEQTAKRFQIAQRIQTVQTVVDTLKGNLASSWWETLNVGSYKSQRLLFDQFDGMTGDIQDVLYALKNAILDESFHGNHNTFCAAIGDIIRDLKREAFALQIMCAATIEDGFVDDDEREHLIDQIDSVKAIQRQLIQAASPHLHITEGLANEALFVFSISFWARKVTTLAQFLVDWDFERGNMCFVVANATRRGLRNTWSPQKMFEPEHLNFAFRNTLSISISFWIGYKISVAVFTEYSSTMASTLSLLISHFSGSAMQKNLQRLLGVTLGKVLPIIILASMGVLSCDLPNRVVAQALTLLMFVCLFCYMYYTSPQWSLVGCLVAGFGTPMLMTLCPMAEDASTYAYEAKYKELGQVTAAIVIQIFVDMIFLRQGPNDIAKAKVIEIGEAIQEGFQAFFEKDRVKLKEQVTKVKSALESAQSLAAETDPKLDVIPGASTPFKYDMYVEVLAKLKDLSADLNMLLVVVVELGLSSNKIKDQNESDVRPSRVLECIMGTQAIHRCRRDIEDQMDSAFQAVQSVLFHFTEDPVDDPSLRDLENKAGILDLDGRSELYEELSQMKISVDDIDNATSEIRTRICVTLRSLRNAAQHLGELQRLCVRKNLY